MSYDAVMSAIRTQVESVAGVVNVHEEDPFSVDEGRALAAKLSGSVVQWWIIEVEPAAPALYLGGSEDRWRIVVKGWHGVAREEPSGGEVSDSRFSKLAAAVLAALSPPSVVAAGILEFTAPQTEPIVLEMQSIGQDLAECHVARIVLFAQED